MLYISQITYLGLTLFVFLTDKNTIGNVYRPDEEFQEADRAVAVVCLVDLYFKPVFAQPPPRTQQTADVLKFNLVQYLYIKWFG